MSALQKPPLSIPRASVLTWLGLGACAAVVSGIPVRPPLAPAGPVPASAAPAGAAVAPAGPGEVLRGDLPTAGRASHHAATLLTGARGQPVAFWFAGSREGETDVCILRSEWDGRRWSDAVVALDAGRASALGRRWIRKLGNPVATRDAAGRLHLYVTTVTLGGWSGSRLLHCVSNDDGRTFVSGDMAVLSPLFNLSTLVKSPAVPANGALLLPVYHELFVKRPLMVALADDGGVASVSRMGCAAGVLQPAVVPLRDGGFGCFLRHRRIRPPRVQWQDSKDGRVWTDPVPLTIPNPNSAIAAAALPNGDIALALNAQDANRNRLSLLVGDGRGHWHEVCAPVTAPVEISYPALLAAPDALHLVCTYDRSRIVHIRVPYAALREVRDPGRATFAAPRLP